MKPPLALTLFLALGILANGQEKSPESLPPTFADVPYDRFEATKLDFWKAEGQGPRPLLVHIHGGGWIGGDKKTNLAATYLKKGVSVASINYRLTPEAILPAPVHDAARAIQFLRSKAGEWNIRKDRVLLTGGSAGACTSMWLLCHEDLADPKSDDPVKRESTRVQGAVVSGGQTSIDPRQIIPWLGPNVARHAMIFRAVGEKSIDDALKNYDQHEALFKEFSPYNHVTRDDPPLYLKYASDLSLPSKNAGHGIHHPVYGVKMKEKFDAVGAICHLKIEGYAEPDITADAFIESILLDKPTPIKKAGLDLPATDQGMAGAGPVRRYDWFTKLWSQKRAEWAKQTEKDQRSFVFLGDSITQGWGPDLKGAFGSLRVANRGISGDTTRGMLYRLPEDVLALRPAGVALLMGTNDLEEGAAPEVIAGNFKLIISELHRHNPRMPIIVSLVFPSSASKKRPADQIKEINRLFQEAVKGDPQVTVIDTWTLFADEKGDARAAEFPDLLHPNEKGYQMWAAALRPILATLGFLETEGDGFKPEEGYQLLFNGKDLTGWGFHATKPPQKPNPNFVEIKEDMAFDGKDRSSDGRYLATHGRLVVTTPPEGRRIQQLWTTREFGKDFTLKLEFRATPNADSGIFIRGKQLQCRDYPLAGPYKELKNYRPGDWNEIEIHVTGTKARCTCNGELLEEAFEVPANGPIGLEGDRGQMEYRRIRIREE